MNTTYSQSFNIPSGGWAGEFNALMYSGAVSTASGITANVVLWRDVAFVGNTLTNNAVNQITLIPGSLLPMKGRYIFHNGGAGTVTGFN